MDNFKKWTQVFGTVLRKILQATQKEVKGESKSTTISVHEGIRIVEV